MKKLIIACFAAALVFGMSPSVNAQERGYEKGKVYFDIGIGAPRLAFGTNFIYSSYGYDSYRLPALRANLEYGFTEFISGGLYAGYSHYGWKWTNSLGDYNERNSYISFGARGTFHIWDFLNEQLDLGLGVEELDVYASLMIGGGINRRSKTQPSGRVTTSSGRAFFGTTVGGKYYFSNRVAGFVEAGYTYSSFGIIGLTFKL